MDAGEEGPLPLIKSFTLTALKLDPEVWQMFLSKDNLATISNFCSSHDHWRLILHLHPDSGLKVHLKVLPSMKKKVLCVCKTIRDSVTKANCKSILIMQETKGGDPLSHIIGLAEEVTYLLITNAVANSRRGRGVTEGAAKLLERQKNAVLLMKAQVEGHTILPYPDALFGHCPIMSSVPEDPGKQPIVCLDDQLKGSLEESDVNLHMSDELLTQACQATVVEWAELVSQYLDQDWSRLVLDRLSPFPAEEHNFWKNRLQNLLLLQKQLMNAKSQKVSSILQVSGSLYLSTLREVYSTITEGVEDAQDITDNLTPVMKILEEIPKMEYHQLKSNVVDIMKEVRVLWMRSKYYNKPDRVVIFLQEICNLFIQLSRDFLNGEEVMRALGTEPGPVLEEVRLVIQTLSSLKQAYAENNANPDANVGAEASANWDIPSHLVFCQLDSFMKRLLSIEEVLSVCLQVFQLDQTVLSGISSRMWTDAVQQVHEDFRVHVKKLSECNCDPTDPEDQNFEPNLKKFLHQVTHLETWLVSVLSHALEDCSDASSAAKLLQMFSFILHRPLIQNHLNSYLTQLVKMIQMDLDQVEEEFYSQKDDLEFLSRFRPAACVELWWIQQLILRTGATLKSYRTFQLLNMESGENQEVLKRFRQVLDLLLNFRDSVRSGTTKLLDTNCDFIQNLPLIQTTELELLEVSNHLMVESVLKGLRYAVRREEQVYPHHTAQLLPCRDVLTQTYLRLSQMVSCYNQVFSNTLQVERPLIEEQLKDLNQILNQLMSRTWGSEGVDELQTQAVLTFCSTLRQTRSNMDIITAITQGWAELDLLQRSHDSLLESGVAEHTCKRIEEEGQKLLDVIQVNMGLYKAEESSHTWIEYLDHIDDQVRDGLFQLLHRALHFLSYSMNPSTSSSALLAVRLELTETGFKFDPPVAGGPSDFLKATINEVYSAAALPPRISKIRQGNYQELLVVNPELQALEEQVMKELVHVQEAAEQLVSDLERYSYLWLIDRKSAFEEFLTYGRQLAHDDLEPVPAQPKLDDFCREMETLKQLSSEIANLDEFIVLHGWLRVDQKPFRTSLLSIIQSWRCMYTDCLVETGVKILQENLLSSPLDEVCTMTYRYNLTDVVVFLENFEGQLPEPLATNLQC